MKSRSEMRRLAVQDPDRLIAEIERLRGELADANEHLTRVLAELARTPRLPPHDGGKEL